MVGKEIAQQLPGVLPAFCLRSGFRGPGHSARCALALSALSLWRVKSCRINGSHLGHPGVGAPRSGVTLDGDLTAPHDTQQMLQVPDKALP
jgi:hypothetical protein